MDDRRFVAVSGEERPEDQILGLVDAVFLRQALEEPHPRRYVIGSGSATEGVCQALATLVDAMSPVERPKVLVDGAAVALPVRDLRFEKPQWLNSLRERDRMLSSPPPLVARIAESVARPEFRWHVTVSAHEWSGRLGGLRVCAVDRAGQLGVVGVGSADSRHRAAVAFRKLVGEPFGFDDGSAGRAIEAIQRLADEGRERLGDPEHQLEDEVLAGRLGVPNPDTGEPLRALLMTSQFPAVWWAGDRANRYTDVLMRDGETPWVVELKVASTGQRRYYRHAIGQVALYQAFVRGTASPREWFTDDHGVDPRRCRAAIAFPRLQGRGATALREELVALGDTFGVSVVELETRVVDGKPSAARTSLRF